MQFMALQRPRHDLVAEQQQHKNTLWAQGQSITQVLAEHYYPQWYDSDSEILWSQSR